jgi:hypothetical protein
VGAGWRWRRDLGSRSGPLDGALAVESLRPVDWGEWPTIYWVDMSFGSCDDQRTSRPLFESLRGSLIGLFGAASPPRPGWLCTDVGSLPTGYAAVSQQTGHAAVSRFHAARFLRGESTGGCGHAMERLKGSCVNWTDEG